MNTESMQRGLRVLAATAFLGFSAASWGNLADAEAAYEKQEYFVAFREFAALAKAGDAVAQAALGRIYLDGKGAPRDSRAAASWYEKAAQQGHAGAQFQLAKMYAAGVGVKADAARAAQLMEKSASQGVVWAMYSLGLIYRDGSGVAKDLVQAHKWLDLAASSTQSAAIAEYIALAKTARTELEPALNPDQLRDAQKLAGAWRATKRSGDTQWQKSINHPVVLLVAGEAADGKVGTPAANQKPDESSPLTRDYFPKS